MEKPYWQKTALPLAGISVLVLVLFYAIFGLLQNESVYFSTVGQYMVNCDWNEEGGFKDLGNLSYTTRTDSNLVNWDAEYYEIIHTQGYHDTDHPMEKKIVPFFPLFPAIWKATFLPISAIGFLNYALFVFGLLILGSVLLKDMPNDRRVILLALILILPTSTVFQMPYAEAVSFLTMCGAVWAWFRKRSLLFYGLLFLFSLSRPVSGILGLAFISTTVYFTILGRATLKMWLHTALVIPALIIGPLLYFAFHNTYYGDFWMFFKMQRHWGSYFRIPETLNDWSFESLAMAFFGFFCLVLPFVVVVAVGFFKTIGQRKTAEKHHLFDGNQQFQTEFLKVLAVAFCLGLTLFALFFQGGSLHSYSRYLLAGPFGIILMLWGGRWILEVDWWKRLLLILVPVPFALTLWNSLSYHWRWDSRDVPFFLFLGVFLGWVLYDKLPKVIFWPVMGIFGLLCVLCQTHFYNSFLRDCWLFL